MSLENKLLGELKERKLKLNDEIFKLSKEKNIYSVEIDRLKKEIETMKEDIKENKEELEYLNQEIDERKQLVGYLEHKVREKEELIQKMDIQIEGDVSILENISSEVINTDLKGYEVEFEDGTKKVLKSNEFSLSPKERLLMQIHFTNIDKEIYEELQENDDNIWVILSDNYPFHVDYRVYDVWNKDFKLNLHMDLEDSQEIDLFANKFNKCKSFWLEPKEEENKYSYMALIWGEDVMTHG